MARLGDTVTDSITGFSGVVTGKTQYLNGCIQLLVTPPGLHDGKPITGQWIDEQRFGPSTATAGGPQDSPPALPASG